MKQLKVDAIKNGTVIDHISAGKALKVIDILKLTYSDPVTIGINLGSKKIGKKDIIKIENRELTQEEVNSISLIAPTASLSIIKNFEVTKKAKVQIPDTVEGLIICPNPKCITNTENISTKFDIISKSVGCLTEKPIKLRCIYCEKVYSTEQVKIKI